MYLVLIRVTYIHVNTLEQVFIFFQDKMIILLKYQIEK
jgi:hypothetical protein